MRYDTHSEQLVKALEEEIQAVRSQKNKAWNALSGGTLLSQKPTWLYCFRSEDVLAAPADSPAKLKVGGREIAVTIVGVEDFDVFISSPDALPPDLKVAELHIDLSYLLQALIDRLQEPGCWNDALVSELFRPSPGNQPTPGQDGAVEAACRRNTLFLWGPPGTGKTTTISRIVEALALAGERVLVTAHTNVAVDAAIGKIAGVLAHHELLLTGKVLRIGYPATDEVRENPYISPMKIAERMRPDLAAEREGLEVERKALKLELRGLESSEADRRREIQLRLSEIGKRKKAIFDELREVEAQLLLNARVVAATLSKLAISREGFAKFDAVIVDEASMAFVPQIVYAAGFATKRVIVVGDFRQLPPICQSEAPLAKEWLEKDIFEHAGIIKAVDAATDDARLARLTMQYRMHPTIVNHCNRLAYKGMLETPKDVAAARESDGLKVGPMPGKPVSAVDVTSVATWAIKDSRHSHFNPMSAAISVALAREAHLSGDVSVGVIAPYAAQARLIRRLLVDARLEDKITVATVHRFQGHERDVIVLDLTDALPQKHPGVLLSGGFGSRAMRLLNVAVSRAKLKVMVVGDREFLTDRSSTNSSLHTFLGGLDQSWRAGLERPMAEKFIESSDASEETLKKLADRVRSASSIVAYLSHDDRAWREVYEAFCEVASRSEIQVRDENHPMAQLGRVGASVRTNSMITAPILVLNSSEAWVFSRGRSGSKRLVRVFGKRFAEGLQLLLGRGTELKVPPPPSPPTGSPGPPVHDLLVGFTLERLASPRCRICGGNMVASWTRRKDALLGCCLKLRDAYKSSPGGVPHSSHPPFKIAANDLTRFLKKVGARCPSCKSDITASEVRVNEEKRLSFKCTGSSCRTKVSMQSIISVLTRC